MFRYCIVVFLLLYGITLSIGIQAENYTVHSTEFKGVMLKEGDNDTISIEGFECGEALTVYLYHEKNVDFDFALFANGIRVCEDLGTAEKSCCHTQHSGHPSVKVWSYKGMGPYRLEIDCANPNPCSNK